MNNIHHEFNNVPMKQDFAIDDLIESLEKSVKFKLGRAQTRLEYVERAVESGKHINDFEAKYSFKDIANINDALIVARALKENGVEKLKLDPAKSLSEQIIAEKDKVKLPASIKYLTKYRP